MPRVRVPRYLHLPTQILWFDLEDLGVVCAAYCIWLVADSWYVAPIVVVAPWLFMTVKSDKPRGFLGHSLYGIGLQSMHLYPGPHLEVFHE
jgi:hypothetical protein